MKEEMTECHGAVPLSHLALQLAQQQGMRINGKYEYSIEIIDNNLYWSVEKLDKMGRKIYAD